MQMHTSPVQLAIRLKAPNDLRPELPPSAPSSSSRQRSDKNANDSQLITQNHPGPVLGNHQFWLNDIKIAESLYTVRLPSCLDLACIADSDARPTQTDNSRPAQIHRSGTHLVEYTSGLLGSGRNDQLGSAANPDNDKPVPIMSDGDVFFMTQLANDIARSVGEISAVRHHGIRAEERKRRHSQRDPARPHQSRRSGSYTKRQRVSHQH